METKHTPGPWEFSDTHVYVLNDEFDEVICRVDGKEDFRVTGDPKRAAANAQLLAAAPEMLAALEEVSQLLPCAGRLHPMDLTALMFKVIGAINNAKGEL